MTTAEEISKLKVNLYREVMTRSSREEELARLREELGKTGSELLEDSELQQKHIKPLRRWFSVRKGQKLT